MPQRTDYDVMARQHGGYEAPAAPTAAPAVDYDDLYRQSMEEATVKPQARPSWSLGDVARGAKDLVIGAGKGLAHTGIDIARAAADSGALPGVSRFSLPSEVTDRARQATDYTNTTQRVGGAIETIAEMAIPGVKGAQAIDAAIPRTARAVGKFQGVMGAARNIPIDITAPGNVALRIAELADRGGSMPMAVRKFLAHVTDPAKPDMTYEVARDFASNISRLSANEYQKMNPILAKEVASMRVALNKATADAAGKAGKAKEFVEAMSEYGRAKKVEQTYNMFLSGMKKGIPLATAAGAGTWLYSRLKDLLPGD